ncbi:hypothetical protein PR202_ga25235 [Eleusine coracana subsp. coracana]|uniref:Ubiquinol-cytochrome c chaperone domain-containing protein n=1 Tax=Eleusine coracana subsp. coracana TaxID=191504 RepID=A0AAV5DAR9_ELECO|nr:hypothetical protein PR202_ga25235 [Eleusine coracana subsp. coracana]
MQEGEEAAAGGERHSCRSHHAAPTLVAPLISRKEEVAALDLEATAVLEFMPAAMVAGLDRDLYRVAWAKKDIDLEKTFKTTFSLLVLHMWLVLRRLKEEGKDGVKFGQYIYEMYNHDVELRVSKAGVNLLLTKWMKELEKIFYGNIVKYDAAISPEARQDDLVNVIWRNIYAEEGTDAIDAAATPAVQASSFLDGD